MEWRTGDRRRPVLRVVLIAWLGAWLVVGALTAVRIRELTQVSNTLVRSGEALDRAGVALQAVGELPVVGQRTRQLGAEVRATAGEIQRTGAASRRTVAWLSVLLGLAIALIPTSPIVGAYVQERLSLTHQRRAIRSALAAPERHPPLERFLAHRAVQNLPFDVLIAVSADPWGDLAQGSYRHLANAELTRLGLAGERR